MDLIINSTAALRSSLGVRRLFSGIMRYLAWPSDVRFTRAPGIRTLERMTELLQPGRKDAIFWSPSHRGPLYARHHVVSVHDCINVEYVYRDDWRLPAFRRLFNIVLARAEAIVALSYSTRDAILRNYRVDDSKIVVIPAGFDVPSQPVDKLSAVKQDMGRPFVLMVTNSLAHKNTESACRAFANSRCAERGIALRVVGSLATGASLLCSQRGVDLELRGHVDDSTLLEWYRTCEFLFSPTLAEGYNLPIAEAIAAGANVLCSNIAVHREFFNGQVTFFDATSSDCMVEALNLACDRTGRWRPLLDLSKSRSFRDVAAEYRALFERIAAASSN
jgi:glycosyltransferase involved in cell wall biosynthesis